MSRTTPARFGIMTPPSQVGYDDILRVWREADAVPQIEHAWLYDHLMPIFGNPNGPTFEGWTLLSALAAQTQRLRVGLLVTSNRFRPPAMLAKIATTVDIVSGGRLDFGIGAGSRPTFRRLGGSTKHTGCRTTTSRTPWRTSPRHSPSSADCGPRPNRSTSPAPISSSPGRSAIRSLSSDRTRRSSSAVARQHCCVWSPSMPTCGTSLVRTSTTPLAAVGCWIATAPRSVATPPPSPGRCSYRSPTTNPRSPAMRSAGPSMRASAPRFGLSNPYPDGIAQWVVDELITTARW